ncbi:MAG TPA: dihydrofolate reductase family protein [Candidatus Limnocylindria bacterium]|nr:dihydrofolate reductase family protein [Candidatus Limnocylindria bacterium]
MLTLLRSVDGMLFGRVAYELLAKYWPMAGTAAAEEAPGGFTSKEREVAFAERMNSIPKIVYSTTLMNPSWTPARVVRQVTADDIARLKREPGKDLVLFAGVNLASVFIDLDLVDEYRLMVHPVALGGGKPLFNGLESERRLKLLRSKTFGSGVVLLQYERDRAAA